MTLKARVAELERKPADGGAMTTPKQLSDKEQVEEHLRTGISEIYQVLGSLAHHYGDAFDHPDVIAALDWLADPDKPCGLLPWPKTPLPATLEQIRAAQVKP